MEEKRRKELERRRSVELRLENQKHEMEEYAEALKEKHSRDVRRAQSMKETREQEIAMVGKWYRSNTCIAKVYGSSRCKKNHDVGLRLRNPDRL